MGKRNRGQVIVLFALALFVLLGFAALGVDVAFMYSVRHELQRCADSGALAGASAFFDGDWASGPIRAVADARARDYASHDNVVSSPLDPAGEVSVGFPQQDRIQVTTRRTVNLFFARVLGRTTQEITASATAEAAVVDRRLPCIKPWGIPFPWNDADLDGTYDNTETVYNICPEGTFIPDNNSFCQGTPLILKIGTPSGQPGQPDVPSIQQEPGHFFALDFGSGGNTYRDMIKGDCPDDSLLSIGDSVPLEPGNMVGPTYQGVTSDSDSLYNQDPTSHWNSEQNLPESDVYTIEGGTWMNSPRVVRIPIYDPRDAMSNGKTEMVISAFAGFWVERCERDGNQGTVYGRFIPMSAFGESSGTNPGPNSGPTLRILRLVE